MTTKEQQPGGNANRVSGHPSVETLVAYHQAGLEPAETERVADHLSRCSHCARLLLDFEGFTDSGSTEPDELSNTDVDRAWREIESRLPAEISRQVHEPPPAIWRKLAASLALVVIGFGAGAMWNRPSGEAPRPAVNVPIVDLFPERSVRGGAPRDPVAIRTEDTFVVVLNLEADSGEVHDLEVVDGAGRRVWSASGAVPDSFGGYTLSLTRDALGEGAFRVLVKAAGATEPIAEFAFSLASSG